MKFIILFIFLFTGLILGYQANRRDSENNKKEYVKTQGEVRIKIARVETKRRSNEILLRQPPTASEVVREIANVFSKERPDVIVRAINCFYSESGLRENARHVNTNGTTDGGIGQINSVHKLPDEVLFDYKKNIAESYKIYKSWGNSFAPWYGSGCR